MPISDPFRKGFLRRTFISLVISIFVLALLIFLPAGDIWWWKGWIFILVFSVLTIVSVFYLAFANPEIFVARSKIQVGTKWWDKVMLFFLLTSLMAIFPVAGFDYRYNFSFVPLWLSVLGHVLFSFGFITSTWVYSVNKFAEPGVRIQAERGQKVIDTGPYAIIRHPLYLASFFLVGGIPLVLGSYWAMIPVVIGDLVLIVRTALEDQMLQNELQGYREYACRVRYRLIPGVW